jgi:hypothetical protein
MPVSRFDGTGRLRPESSRWNIERLNATNRLWGANGIAFGPDGRLYVAQFLGGQISAVDVASGDVEVVVPLDSPVRTPDDLAFAADGTMYIADLEPGRVWRRAPDGDLELVSDVVQAPVIIADGLGASQDSPSRATTCSRSTSNSGDCSGFRSVQRNVWLRPRTWPLACHRGSPGRNRQQSAVRINSLMSRWLPMVPCSSRPMARAACYA